MDNYIKKDDSYYFVDYPVVFVENCDKALAEMCTDDRNVCVGICQSGRNIEIIVSSITNEIRAIEMLDFMLDDIGIFAGDEKYAQGKLTGALIDAYMAEWEVKSAAEYFIMRIGKYFQDTDIIRCTSDEIDVSAMAEYHKKHIPWAVVKTEDIGDIGSLICVKSLENSTGVEIEISKDSYIMVGCRGEVYDISRKKFEHSYDVTEEKLDIFENILDFIPTVESVKDRKYIPIDEMAHICYPKSNSFIYTREITRRTKVFGAYNKGKYFIGKPGDYLAVRGEDKKDAYIIKHDIFIATYEK